MNLKVTIQNIKAIDNLTLELPVEKGLYAITGENATGKSTITMCAVSLFYHFNAKQYFGEVSPNSSVSFELNNNTQSYSYLALILFLLFSLISPLLSLPEKKTPCK